MLRSSPPFRRSLGTLLAAVGIASTTVARPAAAQAWRLKDGRVLEGAIAATAGIAESPNDPSPQAGELAVYSIAVIDDGLRRVFISRQKLAENLDQALTQDVTVRLWQDVATAGGHLSSIGPSLGITPFDEFGRRIYRMQTAKGPLSVVQGITEITPRYAKVEALRGSQPRSVVWDMRLATSSIPPATLTEIFAQSVPRDDPEARLQVVRFYIAGERYARARSELQQVVEAFPDLEGIDGELRTLRQLHARRILEEIRLRRGAGQDKLAKWLLESFPSDDVPGETLAEVRQLVAEYQRVDAKIEHLKARLAELADQMSDPDERGLVAPLAAEIAADLSPNNYDRLAAFSQLADDDSLPADEKVALALSGWLLGGDNAEQDLASAVALVRLRDAVLRYLREPIALQRQAILDDVRSLPVTTVENLAKLIAHIKPPWHDPVYTTDPTGAWQLTAPGATSDGDFMYHVQLPPEYDPYRRYPTLVVLNGAHNTPEQELDFWAGSLPPASEKLPRPRRIGQAGRQGYITLAVDWLKPQQYRYEYSAREHLAVLTTLRDAMRKFGIDPDRVYLSGHGIGGDAAWDLAQSHPDLWAGVVPIVARGEKYVRHYWENAQYVPWYFVAGEKDGTSIKDNAPLWDRYVKKLDFDATVIEYQGRGHEPFHDELLHVFDWMGRRQRSGPPEKFACNSMRPWDNFFWWIECRDFDDRWLVYPSEWSNQRATNATVEGAIRNGNRLLAETVANEATIWLSPEIVDFDKPIDLSVNHGKFRPPPGAGQPKPEVLLEDVRTRGDRRHPFWAKIEWP